MVDKVERGFYNAGLFSSLFGQFINLIISNNVCVSFDVTLVAASTQLSVLKLNVGTIMANSPSNFSQACIVRLKLFLVIIGFVSVCYALLEFLVQSPLKLGFGLSGWKFGLTWFQIINVSVVKNEVNMPPKDVGKFV